MKKLKAAFELFIKTFADLSSAIREQTATNRTIEAQASLRHEELLAAIGDVSEHTKFLSDAERGKLQRAGHKV